MDMNIEKNTQAFSQCFPEECEKHFNLLAKRRFKSGASETPTKSVKLENGEEYMDEEEEEEEGKAQKERPKKKKSALEKRLAEKMATCGESKSEQELVHEVVSELKEKENKGGQVELVIFSFIEQFVMIRSSLGRSASCGSGMPAPGYLSSYRY